MSPLHLTLLLCAAPASAQTAGNGSETLYQWHGVAEHQGIGCSVAGAGDVNRDGFADVIVGAPGTDIENFKRAGVVYVYSGKDGSILHQWRGQSAWDYFGLAVSRAGDVNRDGFSDLIVGAPRAFNHAGSTYVYSGADGSLIHQWNGKNEKDRLGTSVAAAGDVNRDGFDDLIVGAPGFDAENLAEAGSAYVYSGADGTLLYHWTGEAANDEFGHSIAGAEDINRDGFDDVIVGASSASLGEFSEEGLAYAYSGKDGSILFKWSGGTALVHFGESVSGAGDVNKDGHADLLVGAPNSLEKAGSAFVFSGKDGSTLRSLHGEANDDLFGSSVANAGDLNGDDIQDLVVGAPGAEPRDRVGAGSVYAYSSDGRLIGKWNGSASANNLGWSVSGAGDLDGDGLDEIIVGAPYSASERAERAGSAYVYSFANRNRLFQWDQTILGSGAVMAVSDAGDVNNDGFDDLLVGNFLANPKGIYSAGSAFVFSGADGSLLHQWNGSTERESVGIGVSGVGDLNRDGHDDVLISSYSNSPNGHQVAGSVSAYSGADGSLLHRWHGDAAEDYFGSAVSGITDVNGDGIRDLLVGAPGADLGESPNTGFVFLYSGADHSLIHQWYGLAAHLGFGSSLADAGDVNKDGTPDIIIGARYASPNGLQEAGSAFVYSGADGCLLHQFHGAAARDRFGFSVSGAGDFNKDGFADLLIGAPLENSTGRYNSGAAYIYSGADGALLTSYIGDSPGDNFGQSVANVGDINGDKICDFAVSALYGKSINQLRTGSINIYSGADGNLLHQEYGAFAISRFGVRVSSAGDVNGDGLADVIVSALSGSAFVFSFKSPK